MQLYTFKSWGKEEILDCKSDGNNVAAVWGNLCIQHIDKIKVNNTFTGKAKEEAQRKMGHAKTNGLHGPVYHYIWSFRDLRVPVTLLRVGSLVRTISFSKGKGLKCLHEASPPTLATLTKMSVIP